MADDRLRIAQIAPVGCPVTPDTEGSIEQVVSLLTEELVRRGHEVTLFATGDSRTSATLSAIYPRGWYQDESLWDGEFHEAMNAAAAFERSREFDVIHSHVYHFALPFTRLVGSATVHTNHVIPNPDIVRCYARYPEVTLVALSEFQRARLSDLPDVPVVYNGIDVMAFPFSPTPGDYLLFLGRLIPEKGPLEAIRVARQAGMRLVMAGWESGYFKEVVAPIVDGRSVEYVGSVSVKERNALLAGAAALLYPITAPESFGLVLVEAMACGTPAVATGLGAVPEILERGVTGHWADDVGSLAALIPPVLALDRGRVRESAAVRFDYRGMVDGYLEVYRRTLDRRDMRWT